MSEIQLVVLDRGRYRFADIKDVSVEDKIIGYRLEPMRRYAFKAFKSAAGGIYQAVSYMEAVKELKNREPSAYMRTFGPEGPGVVETKCECGSEAARAIGHSRWCPKYEG